MKNSSRAPSATSLPRAPRDDAGARSMKYIIMMSIRVVCFILMVVVTPYGWYTWVFGAGAVVLPYIAVVIANVSSSQSSASAENPEFALPATPSPASTAPEPSSRVIRVEETRAVRPPEAAPPSDDARPEASAPADAPRERREDDVA